MALVPDLFVLGAKTKPRLTLLQVIPLYKEQGESLAQDHIVFVTGIHKCLSREVC